MAKWNYNLDVKTEWKQADENAITTQQLASVFAKKLSKIDFHNDVNFERDDFVDELECLSEDLTAGKDDFDDVLSRLYDFADEYHLWIKTF
jgi:hypothetical protein